VTSQNPHDELKKLASSFTLSSKVYSDALSQLTRHTASIDAVSKAVTKQRDIERRLFGLTSAVLENINRAIAISPSLQSLSATNASLTRMADRLSIPGSSFAKIFESQKRFQDMIKGIQIGNSLTSAFARINSTLMLSASLAAQTKLANLESLSLGRIAGINSAFSKAMTINLGNLTRSYESLIDVAITRDSLGNYLPLITTYPPVEYYREISVIETLTVDEGSEGKTNESINAAIGESLPSVDALLADLDPDLCRLLEGARQSLRVNNADQARHVTTSVRELFTKVLHALAPEEHVRKWTTNSEFFHDNRPTRRARLLYICRNINCDPLIRFVEDDVCAALSFVDSLNAETHVIKSKLTTAQLSAIVSRIESLLLFLLQL